MAADLQRSFWREHQQKTPSFRWKNLQVRSKFSEMEDPLRMLRLVKHQVL